jgi:hypothetical protein
MTVTDPTPTLTAAQVNDLIELLWIAQDHVRELRQETADPRLAAIDLTLRTVEGDLALSVPD